MLRPKRRISLALAAAGLGLAILLAVSDSQPREPVNPLGDGWANCEQCHPEQLTGLPGLSRLRPSAAGALAADACLECHKRAELSLPHLGLTHPLRSIGEHIACTACHLAAPHSAADPPPMPAGDYDAEGCFACHRDVQAQASLASLHTNDPRISCSGCHPAHGRLSAAMPLDILPAEVASAWAGGGSYWRSNELCLKCHPEADLFGQLNAGFVTLHTANYHDLHVRRGECLCIECHDPHGSIRPAMLRQTLMSSPALLWRQRIDGANCTVRCHGIEHENWGYTNRVQ